METYDILRELITNLVWIQQEIDDNGGPANWENAEMNLQYSDMRFKILDSVGLDDTRENIKLCYVDNFNCEDEEDRPKAQFRLQQREQVADHRVHDPHEKYRDPHRQSAEFQREQFG